MGSFKAAVMTERGAQLLRDALAGTAKIEFTAMFAGDGEYTEAEAIPSALMERTALKQQRQSVLLSSIEAVPGTNAVKLTGALDNTSLSGGYYVREIGIYAKDTLHPDLADVLYSIVLAEIPDYMPPYNHLSPTIIMEEYFVTVDNTENVTITVGSSAYVTTEAFEQFKEDVEEEFSNMEHVSDDIADSEATSTASKGYSEGEYLLFNDNLYEATDDISSGDTIEEGVNVERTQIGKVLTILNKKSKWEYYNGLRYYNLGTEFSEEQAQMLAAGDFSELWNGDFWENGGDTIRIIDNMEPFYQYEKWTNPTDFKHHVVVMNDNCILKADSSTTRYMKDTNDTTGAYAGTKYRTTYKQQCDNYYKAFFGAAHLGIHKELISDAVANGKASHWIWDDASTEIPSETNMIGHPSFGESTYNNGFNEGTNFRQFKLFQLDPRFIMPNIEKVLEYFWERDVVSAAYFAYVDGYGFAAYNAASYTYIGVRPYSVII
ncbi:MAG: phage tail protein [Lachnospiraceae bacterium]|nr:phage tail protein [Lachnospiraceae bacterium]